jgi:hypothetical protein
MPGQGVALLRADATATATGHRQNSTKQHASSRIGQREGPASIERLSAQLPSGRTRRIGSAGHSASASRCRATTLT